MLPRKVFENLTRARDLRVERRSGERRAAARVPIRLVASVHRLEGGKLSAPTQVRIKDISATGISFITTGSTRIPGEFILKMQPVTTSSFAASSYWVWCQFKRRDDCDRTCSRTSATFMKILAFGTPMGVGHDVNSLKWLDVEGDSTPSDEAFRMVA